MAGRRQSGSIQQRFDGQRRQPCHYDHVKRGGALLSTIYTHGTDFFMARINALEEKNAARMLGRPSVLTVDNVQAVLENTTTTTFL